MDAYFGGAWSAEAAARVGADTRKCSPRGHAQSPELVGELWRRVGEGDAGDGKRGRRRWSVVDMVEAAATIVVVGAEEGGIP